MGDDLAGWFVFANTDPQAATATVVNEHTASTASARNVVVTVLPRQVRWATAPRISTEMRRIRSVFWGRSFGDFEDHLVDDSLASAIVHATVASTVGRNALAFGLEAVEDMQFVPDLRGATLEEPGDEFALV